MKIKYIAALLLTASCRMILSAQTLPIYSYSVPSSGGYAPNSNIINYSDQITGSWNMEYDNLNRLQNAASSSGYYNGLTLQWQYDSFGNRLSQTPSGTYSAPVPGAISATYNQNNRIATSSVPGMGPSSYDAAGNVIFDGNNQIAYDAENRICAVLNSNSTLTQYLYNAEGQRVAKGHSASGSTLACPVYGDFIADEKYILGQGGEQVTQLNGSDQWQHSNVWANGQLLATYDPQGLHFNITDPLGTKRVQTDANGTVERNCVSLPFGDGLSCFGGTDATQHHFTGKERDAESGLDNFGYRYYASTMGRFSSPDPSGLYFADPTNPQSLNLYSYALNNPLRNTDPTGLYCYYGDTGGGAQNDADLQDSSQFDYHSSQSECTKADANGNSGQWINDSETHQASNGDWVDNDNRPDNYTMSSTPASIVTPQFGAKLSVDLGLTVAAGVADIGLIPANYVNSLIGAQQIPILRFFGTTYCGKGGAGRPNGGFAGDCQVHDNCFDRAGLDANVNSSTSGLTPAQMDAARACNQGLYNAAASHPNTPGSAALQYWLTGNARPFGYSTIYPGTEARR
jgi:RHS repeat-associated protein